MSHQRKKFGILVGGGPAPGINAVISAATIRAIVSGYEVLGIQNGFSNLMKGDISHVRPLGLADVTRIHSQGGSYIGISRANPTKSEELLEECVTSLLRLEVDKLITIGGDDTAFSASQLERRSRGRLRVAHVPKTIDNDLDLPENADTFGFQTARHVGVEIIGNLMTDARTTSRWYFIVAMGRKAGHLALGMGKAAGATLTLIPEEFPGGPNAEIPLRTVVDLLVGSILKRLATGRSYGVAILAEGLVERMREADLASLPHVERDAHGHIRLAEIAFGDILKEQVQRELARYGVKMTIVSKNIGYELRCTDPIPYDMEYARDLGYAAAKFLVEGGNACLISMVHGVFRALPFDTMMDRATGRVRVRYVDISSDRYMIARRYMIRLRRDDFEDPYELAKIANQSGLSLDDFTTRYRYLVENEPSPRPFVEGAEHDPEHSLRPPPVA